VTTSLAIGDTSLDVSAVQVMQVQCLKDDDAKHDTEDNEITDQTSVIVRLLIGLVQLGTNNVPDSQANVDHSSGSRLLCVPGRVGETPRKNDRGDRSKDLKHIVYSEQLVRVLLPRGIP